MESLALISSSPSFQISSRCHREDAFLIIPMPTESHPTITQFPSDYSLLTPSFLLIEKVAVRAHYVSFTFDINS